MRFLKLIVVLAMVFAMSAIAYAETQSVKVSGDITLRTFARNNYDLDNDDANFDMVPIDAANIAPIAIGGIQIPTRASWGTESSDWATYLQSSAEIQIDADLTDNVSAVIRLVNQRVWGDNMYINNMIDGEIGWTNAPFMDRQTPGLVTGIGSFNIELDLAYIELKEFLYSPLTLRLGVRTCGSAGASS